MNNFEAITKKNKRKTLLKTIGLSVLASFMLLFLGTHILNRVVWRNYNHIWSRYQTMSQISAPNIGYLSAYSRATSQFTGVFYSDRVKDLAGVTVPYDTYTEAYSLRSFAEWRYFNHPVATPSGYYQNGHRVARFYNAQASRVTERARELPLLDQMDGQLVEVAISFDQPYSFAEIAELVPDNLKINWYWIGSGDKTEYFTNHPIGLSPTNAVLNADQAVELETLAGEGVEDFFEQIDPASYTAADYFANDYSHFVRAARQAIDKGWLEISYYQGTELSDLVAQYLEANPDGRSAKFSGIILTGRAENFAQLDNQDWIYASSIGHSVQIQPYHQLEVE